MQTDEEKQNNECKDKPPNARTLNVSRREAPGRPLQFFGLGWLLSRPHSFQKQHENLRRKTQEEGRKQDGNHEPECSHLILRWTGHNQIIVCVCCDDDQHFPNTLLHHFSTTLFSNTSLHRSSPTLLYTALLQHTSTTLLCNTYLQHFPTTL